MEKSLTKEKISQILKKEWAYLRSKYGVERMAIYGSFAKGNQRRKSDVDILVQLAKPLGLEFVELACYLEEVLGRKVDLATFDSLNRALKDSIRKDVALEIKRTLSYV